MDACLKKAELKGCAYPRSEDDVSALCQAAGTGQEQCRKTWKTLAAAPQLVREDYKNICSHLRDSSQISDCRDNCLEQAAGSTKQALADTTKTGDHVKKIRKAVKENRDENLRVVRALILQLQNQQQNQQQRQLQNAKKSASAGPRRDGWRVAGVVGEFLRARFAWAFEGVDPLNPYDGTATPADPTWITPTNVPGTPNTSAEPPPTPPASASRATDPPNGDTVTQAPDYGPGNNVYHGPSRDSLLEGGEKSEPTAIPNANDEATAFRSVSGGSQIPPNLNLRPAVRENLTAAQEASKASRELTQKQQQLAQDQQHLQQQLAELESRRNNLATAPSTPEAPARAIVRNAPPESPQPSDSPNGAGFSPGSPGGLTGASPTGSANDPALEAAQHASSPSLVRRPASLPESDPAKSSDPSSPGAGTNPRASRIALAEDEMGPSSAHSRRAPPGSHGAREGRGAFGSLARALRNSLSAPAAGGDERDASGHLKTNSPAEGAIASVLRDDASVPNGSGMAALSGGGLPSTGANNQDLSGLTPAGHGSSRADGFSGEESQTAPEILESESAELFERVHRAHRRFEKTARVHTAKL